MTDDPHVLTLKKLKRDGYYNLDNTNPDHERIEDTLAYAIWILFFTICVQCNMPAVVNWLSKQIDRFTNAK